MKRKNYIKIWLLSAVIAGLGVFTSCDNAEYDVLDTHAFIKEALSGTSSKVNVSVDGESKTTLNIHLSDLSTTDNHYKLVVDPSVLDEFNRQNGTSYITLPKGQYILPEDILVKAGEYNAEETEITLEAVSNGVKLTATSEVEIQYISYAWDNGEPTQIEVGNTTYEGTIETPQGRHTLNIEVVDINNNKGTKEQVVVGDTAPTLTVNPARVDGKLVFTIDAEDDEEISRIEITLNDGEKQIIEVNAETYHGEVEIVDGENRLVVTAYNLNNLSVTSRKLFRN